MELIMAKTVSRPAPKAQPAPKVQPVSQRPAPKPNQGSVGGKSLIPLNLREFPIEQLQGHSLRELQEISKNRAKPPVDRIIKPPFVMPKKGNT